ncbi:MAG: 50S ribosomal protein L29 [Flavobacteriaceae bacterium]|jgi:large subunit ribosomal protein L29|nr:50S ribosomal protein L29 [Flavobacteriaceae bacterium]MDG1967932.1 50S ribosomal protein L29 [Flavobacteriaceae bacterium]CAI8188867.1 MAG: 50S ribosomal protein L29 [Flavobacteriaceae bacterium]HCZ09926.1 50S ribosomal protein L29 [Flavobacteriaceae bacterium]|tara:strand:+ start:225 stop:428 length:204 start_codon:yes stop_codon:yes gene_type:complete
MKTSEIEKLSLEDLKDKLQEQQKQLKDLKMNHAVSPLENPLQIKAVRRTVARLLTAITSKENEIIAQ